MNNIPGHVRPGGTSHVSPEGLIYCTDGKLRWVYEIDQRKKPTVLLSLLWKYVAAALVVGAMFLRLPPDAGIFTIVMAQLSLIGAAAALALVMFGVRLLENGRYICLVYTLDDQTASCQQVKGKTRKEKVTHAFAVWVGGQSQPAVRVCALREVRFDHVRVMEIKDSKQRIELRGKKNLALWLEPQQLQPVLNHLKVHCLHMEDEEELL
ncbi:MAG: hypothetical protein IJA11_02585 [Oscillospiraceae bacterium]|nr:hypothetical protein [Oscillospiraceae bacterium]